MSGVAGATLILIGLTTCEPTQRAIISGVWRVAETGLELRIDDNLEAQLCVPALNVMVKLGVLSIERDAFDRYHFKTTLLDSALNTEVPLSLVGALSPAEMTLGRALGHVEYVLRFCKATGEVGHRTLTCGESGLEQKLKVLTEVEGGAGNAECEPPTVCRLTDELFPDPSFTLVDCLQSSNAPCLPSSLPDTTSLCDVIAAAERCPDALRKCLAKTVDTNAVIHDDLQIDSACEAMEMLESLPELEGRAFTTCDELPEGTLPRQLCEQVETFVTSNNPNVTPILQAVGDACAIAARLDDIDLLCCRFGGDTNGESPPDAGVDASPDARRADAPVIDAPPGTCNPACTFPQTCCAATGTCTLPTSCL